MYVNCFQSSINIFSSALKLACTEVAFVCDRLLQLCTQTVHLGPGCLAIIIATGHAWAPLFEGGC